MRISRTRFSGRFSATTVRANVMAASSAPFGVTSSNSAVPARSRAEMVAPDTIMLSAVSTPTTRGRRCVPPAPGSKPIMTPGEKTDADLSDYVATLAARSTNRVPGADPSARIEVATSDEDTIDEAEKALKR